MELRVGFFGVCVQLTLGWTCSPDFGTVANKVSELSMTADANTTESYDPLDLLNVGKRFRDEVVFDGLLSVPLRLRPPCAYPFNTVLNKLAAPIDHLLAGS